jgi:O-antigen/teichoic acid export membrane protein
MISESTAYAAVEAGQNLIGVLIVPASLFWLSPADMGVVTLGLLISQIVLVVSTLGLDFALIRYYFTWPAEDRNAFVGGILASCTAASVGITIAATVTLALSRGSAGGVWSSAIAIGTGFAIRATPMAVYRVTSRLRQYAIVAIGGSIVQGLLQIALLASGAGVVGYLAGAMIGAWLSAIVACVMLIHEGAVAAPRWFPTGVIKLAALNTLSSLFNRFVASADRLAVFAWSTPDALGIYGTAARWTIPVRLVGGATKTALAPALSRQEALGDLRSMGPSVIAPFVILLSFLAAVVQLSSWLLYLTPWAGELVPFQRLLSLLVLAQVLGAITVIDQLVLYYLSRPVHSVALAAFNAVAGVAGLIWLVPRYGATGAALVQLGANAATLGLVSFWSGGTLRTSSRTVAVLLALVCGTLAVWVMGAWATASTTAAATALLGVWSWQQVEGRKWIRRFSRAA